MLEILTYPDPRLNHKAIPVTKFDSHVKKIVDKMLATMYEAEGVGLASIQVNIQERITVIDISPEGNQPQILINPEIIFTNGFQTSDEGCLSFPEIRIKVTRPQSLIVKAQDLTGKEFTIEAQDFLAKAIHHECEHLDGEVFIKDLSRLKQNLIVKKLLKQKRIYQTNAE